MIIQEKTSLTEAQLTFLTHTLTLSLIHSTKQWADGKFRHCSGHPHQAGLYLRTGRQRVSIRSIERH